MTDVLITPAFIPTQADSGDTTKFGPNAWKAPRLFTGGGNARDLLMRDGSSSTGASWVSPSTAVTKTDLGLGLVTNVALPVSYTVGDLLYASSAGTLSKLGIGAAGTVLIGGATPSWTNALAINTLSLGLSNDVILSRSAASTLHLDDGAGGALFTIGGSLNTTGQISAGTYLIGTSGVAPQGGSRGFLLSPADGQFNFLASSFANGVGFDFATDAVLKIRTKAQSGYATVDCLGLKASGVAGVNFGPAHPASITIVNGIVTAAS